MKYRCHECGNVLTPQPGRLTFWCAWCVKVRRKPTHPALVVKP